MNTVITTLELENMEAVQYSSIASLAFLVWDICITMDQEVEYIWRKPNSNWPKWLYLFTRYFTVAVVLILILEGRGALSGLSSSGQDGCRGWFVFQCLATQAVSASVELLLMIRVYALYQQSRLIGWVLTVLFCAETLSIIPVYTVLIPEMTMSTVCSPTASTSTTIFFAYVSGSATVMQAILLFLTLTRSILTIRVGLRKTPLVSRLALDGTWAFVLQFLAVALNTVLYHTMGPILGNLFFTWYMSILAFSSCRLVLNLYSVGLHDLGEVVGGSVNLLSTNLPTTAVDLDDHELDDMIQSPIDLSTEGDHWHLEIDTCRYHREIL